MPFPKTTPQVSFTNFETEVLDYWKVNDTFRESIRRREAQGAPDYVFYDGPPFATGLPHYGHILTSYIKDTVPRYHTMKGKRVDRRFGWDCHGLPIENEIEREIGINGKQEIEQYGIDTFNARCAGAVTRYTKEWEEIITRLGRWVDFDRDYKTMDLDYMESVLHVFWRLYDKGLIYEGDKVVPYCYRCQTPLSNFEARLDDSFRSRQDPSVTVRFRVLGSDGEAPEYFLAWTTTPWTLPSNTGLAVGPDVEYVCVRDDSGSYWLAAERLDAYQREFGGGEVVGRVKGAQLAERSYEPLFDYFADLRAEGAFRVVTADFVSTEDGTGIVHLAPAFGEEDYEVGRTKGLPRPNPVDSEGRFSSAVRDFTGENVHDANKGVIRRLKEDGKLVRQETIEHNYPHCWRDDTPLIYKTVPTWYVNVLAIKEKMLASNQKINWVPAHIRDGRFGDWLSNARDWAISRSRFWGAPIPVWRCDKSGELYVPSSVAELSEKWGQTVTDLHRPAIDQVAFPSPAGGTFRRVPEVLDCWFESGSMPYAQVHYPFENKDWFEKNFPADFIVEYIAQTRGWFYTLVVLSAALFEDRPFTNCICHGVVLAADGRKMSKRLKNYPDPMEVVGKYGSDSLRIALLSSPVVRGGNLCFKERDVEEAMRSIMIPFWNAFHFFATYGNIDGWTPPAGPISDFHPAPYNHTDRYLLAKLEDVKAELDSAMEAYDIVAAYEALITFIDQLNNWYIRLSRRRFWSGEATESKDAAYAVLYTALVELSLISAPFTPFMSEQIYRGLTGDGESVHLQDWPARRADNKGHGLVVNVETVQKIIFLGRQIREQHNIKNRQPLRHVGVAGVAPELLQDYADELRTEMNVKEVEALAHPEEVVRPVYKPVSKVLGPKLGKAFKDVMGAMREGRVTVLEDGRAEVAGHTIERDEYTVEYTAADTHSGVATAGNLIVILTTDIDPELLSEGVAREVIRAVQVLRKETALDYTDRIELALATSSEDVRAAVEKHRDWIGEETLATRIDVVDDSSNGEGGRTFEIDGAPVTASLNRVVPAS